MRNLNVAYEENVALDRLDPFDGNPNQGDDGAVAEMIEANGWYGALIVEIDGDPADYQPGKTRGRIIGGHTRDRTLTAAGEQAVPAVQWIRTDGEDHARRLLVADNRSTRLGYDDPALAIALLEDLARTAEGLTGTGYDGDDLDAIIAEQRAAVDSLGAGGGSGPLPAAGPTLADRFVVPPFSVLDARQGYWQDRKRQWLALGIESEKGRATNLLNMSEAVATGYSKQHSGAYGASGKQGEDGRLVYEATVGLSSVFDPVLCELAYRWWAPPESWVLDPFAGGSVRGVVASRLGLRYVGIELRDDQIEANREQAEAICEPPGPSWVAGDSAQMLTADLAPVDRFDFLFSCPPYWNLEQYGDDPADLSNAPSWGEFRDRYDEIVRLAVERLADDRFACFVVGNLRDKHGSLLDLGEATVAAFGAAGCSFYNDAILVTPAGSLALRAGRIFNSRKLGRSHQQVLVFVKGDPAKAVEACGEIELPDPAELFGEPLSPVAGGVPSP